MPKTTAKKATRKAGSARASKANGKNGSARASAVRRAKPARRSAPKKKAVPVPPQYGTATPHLIVSPCSDALEFYTKAFGAKVLMKMDAPGGLIAHAEIKIGDSIVMLADEMEMPGENSGAGNTNRKSPKNAGATTGGVMLYVKNVDDWFERAVSAGASAVMPPADQFWGDRYGQLEDPFGHVWALATHVRDLTPKQMREAAAQMGAASA